MKTKEQIEEELRRLSSQGDDGDNPFQERIMAQANILAWVMDKDDVYDIDENNTETLDENTKYKEVTIEKAQMKEISESYNKGNKKHVFLILDEKEEDCE